MGNAAMTEISPAAWTVSHKNEADSIAASFYSPEFRSKRDQSTETTANFLSLPS